MKYYCVTYPFLDGDTRFTNISHHNKLKKKQKQKLYESCLMLLSFIFSQNLYDSQNRQVVQSSNKVLVEERETEREQEVKDFVYNF